MKTVLFHELGGIQNLSLEKVKIEKPKEKQVQVKITSIGLNRADSLFREGRYFFKPIFPSRVGFEGAGIIESIGDQVTKFKVGDRVGLIPLSYDVSSQGCIAEYGIYLEDQLISTPNNISDEIAGGIWMQYLTAWGGLVTDGCLKKGEWVTITAASSSVGIAAIQIAKMLGANPIATTTSPEKIEILKQHGVEHVINMKTDDYASIVKELSGGKGTNLVFDAVAGPSTQALVRGAAYQSKIIIQGLLDRRPMDIHAGVLMKKLLTVKGFTLDIVLKDASAFQLAIEGIQRGFEEGFLTPVIAKKFQLSEYQEAFQYLESNQQVGKIIINP
ncbi:MAG: NADPH:quinone reductase-like Zn-dependent oxidoreductase [bacterium]|jgi:NADPH:quinone reductase-like Zn-dependent oxidoreductase